MPIPQDFKECTSADFGNFFAHPNFWSPHKLRQFFCNISLLLNLETHGQSDRSSICDQKVYKSREATPRPTSSTYNSSVPRPGPSQQFDASTNGSPKLYNQNSTASRQGSSKQISLHQSRPSMQSQSTSFDYRVLPSKLPGAASSANTLNQRVSPPKTFCGRQEQAVMNCFKQTLNAEARKQKLFGSDGDWKKVIICKHSQKHYDILVSSYKNNKKCSENKYKTDHVTELIRMIRNKYMHFAEVPQQEFYTGSLDSDHEEIMHLHELDWIGEGKDWMQECAQFFVKLFPKLITFLWVQLISFRDKSLLEVFYNKLECPISEFPLDTKQLLTNICKDLRQDLHKGGMGEVFTDADDLILEFRTMKSENLRAIIPEVCFTIMFGIVEKSASGCKAQRIIWDTTANHVIDYDVNDFSQNDLSDTVIVITENPRKAKSLVLKHTDFRNSNSDVGNAETQKQFVNVKKVIVVAADVEDKTKCKMASSLNKTLTRRPIRWSDINRTESRPKIRNKSFLMNGVLIPLHEILSSLSVETRDAFINTLEGEQLAGLLGNRSPNLFASAMSIKKPDVYIPREFKKKYQANLATILSVCEEKERVLVVKDANKNLPVSLSETVDTIQSEEIFKLLIEKKDNRYCQDKIVHFFTYIGDDTYNWRCSHGSKVFESYFNESQSQVLSDEELVEDVKNHGVVCFSNKAGFGKTTTMKKIFLQSAGSLSLFLQISELVHEFSNAEVNRETITSLMVEKFCKTEFEKTLLRHKFNTNATAFPPVQLMLDGYDETDEIGRQVIIKFLDFFRQNIPSVRIFVSVRTYLEKDIREQCDVVVYNLQKFKREQQINCLAKHWNEFLKKHPTTQRIRYSFSELKQFAEACLNKTGKLLKKGEDIFGTPILCAILATIVEKDLHKFHFKALESVSDLYEKLIKRKVLVYSEEKARILGYDSETLFGQPTYKDICLRHIYYSLKLVLSEETAEWFRHAFRLDISEHNAEYILQIGLIDSISPLVFGHRTIAEYLVALFFAQVATQTWTEILRSDVTYEEVLWGKLLCVSKRGEYLRYLVFVEFFNSLVPDDDFDADLRQQCDSLLAQNKPLQKSIAENYPFFNFLKTVHVLQKHKYNNILYSLLYCPVFQKKIFVLGLIFHKFDFCKRVLENAAPPDFIKSFRFEQLDGAFGARKLNVFHAIGFRFDKYILGDGESGFMLPDVQVDELTAFVEYIQSNYGYEVDPKSPNNQDILKYAVCHSFYHDPGLLHWVKLLVEDFNISVHVKYDGSLLHRVAEHVKTFFRKPMTPENEAHDEVTYNNLLKVWNYLIEKGLDARITDAKQQTAYHLLIESSDDSRVISFFDNIEPEVSIKKDKWGNDLLFKAVRVPNSSMEVIEKLINLGCDLHSKSGKGNSVLELVAAYNRPEVFDWIYEKMYGELNTLEESKNHKGHSILYYAAKNLSFSVQMIKRVLTKSTYSLDAKNSILGLFGKLQGDLREKISIGPQQQKKLAYDLDRGWKDVNLCQNVSQENADIENWRKFYSF